MLFPISRCHFLVGLLTLINVIQRIQGEEYHEWLIKIAGTKKHAIEFASNHGIRFVDEMVGMPNHYIFYSQSPEPFGKDNHRVKRNALVVDLYPQKELIRKKRSPHLYWNDPLYKNMWYLHRSVHNPNQYDMNVIEAWDLGMSGKGVVVTIMDDGVDYTHNDLQSNYDKNASYDINGRDNDPMPDIQNRQNHHGTRCAGQVAASGNNTHCIVGVAYEASIGGIRMLDGKITDRVEAEALMYNVEYIDIYSGSWGPDDSGQNHEGPGKLASYAFNTAISKGRNGLGAIFIWASGNGGNMGDSCAFDGYASNIYTISISSVTESNDRPWYQERCTSTLASTYSSGSASQKQILSIDLFNRCTETHTGTSASAPLAAGFVALLLQANRNLNWRDVQYIIVLTSNTKPFRDGRFTTNAAGRNYSMFYGFGLMDAGKMVRLGKLWRQVPDQHICRSAEFNKAKKLQGSFDISIKFQFDGCQNNPADSNSGFITNQESGNPVNYIEHLQLFLDLEYSYRGILRIQLISPSGTVATIMPTRINDHAQGNAGFRLIPLTTVQFWGENLRGIWTLRIDNQNACREIEEGYVRQLNMNDNCKNIIKKVKHHYGVLNTTRLFAFGTEEFPIRLNPPSKEGKFAPPKEWFSSFEKYVIDEKTDNQSSSVHYKCHLECDPYGGCSGPDANHCLSGCKNFITPNGFCINECPKGTSVVSVSDEAKSANRTRGKLCGTCSTKCKTCFRPYSQIYCTSCQENEYLIPLINNYAFESHSEFHIKVPDFMGTCQSDCPKGYYKDNTKFLCMRCAKNCSQCTGETYAECTKCREGFTNGINECIKKYGIICPQGTQYIDAICQKCGEIKSDIVNTTTDSGAMMKTEPPTSLINEENADYLKCESKFCLTNGKCAWCSNREDRSIRNIYIFDGKCLKNSCPKGTFVSKKIANSWTFSSNNDDDLRMRRNLSSKSEDADIWQCEICPPGCTFCEPMRINDELTLDRMPLDFPTKCLKCDLNSVVDNSLANSIVQSPCLSDCPKGYYNESVPIAKNSLVNNECMAKCSDECATCNLSAEHCLTCKSLEYALSPNKKPYFHYNCVDKNKCPVGYYLNQSPSILQCSQCPPGCQSCNGPKGCTSCHEGYILHENGACLVKDYCDYSEYYDAKNNICSKCHSTCETCIGPSMNQCSTCYRNSESQDSCLWISESPMNTLTEDEDKNGRDSTASGLCIKCCNPDFILLNEKPTNCYFCMANKMACLDYDIMINGFKSIDKGPGNEKSNNLNNNENSDEISGWSPWDWITAKASRLVLVALCLGLGLSSLIFVSFHFYMLRKCCNCSKNIEALNTLFITSKTKKDDGSNGIFSKSIFGFDSSVFNLQKPKISQTNRETSTSNNSCTVDEARLPLRENYSFNNSDGKTPIDNCFIAQVPRRPSSYHEKDKPLIANIPLSNVKQSSSQPLPNVNQKIFHIQKSISKSISPEINSNSSSGFSNNSSIETERKVPKSEKLLDQQINPNSLSPLVRTHRKYPPHRKSKNIHLDSQESLSGIAKDISKNIISPLSIKNTDQSLALLTNSIKTRHKKPLDTFETVHPL